MRPLIKIGDRDIKITGRFLRMARLDADGFLYLEDPQAFIKQLQDSGHRIDVFSFMQRLPDTTPHFNYRMELDNFAVVPITTFEHWWNEQIGFKARNKAKQAEKKGVVVREVQFDEALARGIHQIHNETPVRQGAPNIHYGKSFERVYRESSTYLDNSIFIGAYLGDELIGFCKLVHDESRTQAATMNILSMIRHRDKAPTNALIAEAVRACAKRGISYLAYARFAYGKKQRSSLSDFKERNGFQRIDLPRYYVPLTAIGALALRLRLHHRLVDRLPASFAAKLRELRMAWYNRKLPSTAEAL